MFTYVFVLALSTVLCWSKPSGLPDLPSPNLLGITTFGPPGFVINWEPLVGDVRNPIAGFKVKVWENEKQTVYHTEEEEGVGQVLIKEIRSVMNPLHIIPKTEPLVQIVGANVTKARFENLKLDEEYQIRVQAFNNGGDEGPYSSAIGIKLHGKENKGG